MAGRVPRVLGCRKTSYTFRSSSVNRLSHTGMTLPPICDQSLALLCPVEGYYAIIPFLLVSFEDILTCRSTCSSGQGQQHGLPGDESVPGLRHCLFLPRMSAN